MFQIRNLKRPSESPVSFGKTSSIGCKPIILSSRKSSVDINATLLVRKSLARRKPELVSSTSCTGQLLKNVEISVRRGASKLAARNTINSIPRRAKTPAAELLACSMHGRVPALIKLKYMLMAASPFGYFRGAVPVMAADLAVLPSTGLISQLCGDAHVRNLGAFAAPDGRLTFDINDFDETIRGPSSGT